MKHPIIRFRIDFGPERAVGPGKISLLEQIERAGSLPKAACENGMSYRRAWLLLDSLNSGFAELVAVMGGYGGGGGTTFTPFGKQLIHLYRAFDSHIHAHAMKHFARPSGWLLG
jgi:molybdate transport system regulatory protein